MAWMRFAGFFPFMFFSRIIKGRLLKMIQDMVAETLKGMSSYLDLLALNWYHITQRESYRRMRRQMQSESRIIPLVCVYSYITAPRKPKSLRISPSTQTTQQKVLLFKRCHSPLLCTGLIKSSLADKLLIQNFKKKWHSLRIESLSCLASFPFVYFNTKRPLSLFQFLVGKGGKSRKQFHVIIYPCLCAMLGPSKENMKLVL